MEDSPEVCAAVLLYGVIEHMEIFMICVDGVQKSVLLRCITRTFYDCTQKMLQDSPLPECCVKTIRSNGKIMEEFCRTVLFGESQFDRYDQLLAAYASFFLHAAVMGKEVPEHGRTIQVLIDVLKSRLVEEKRFQEIVAAFLGILPPDSVAHSEYLTSYLDSALISLGTFHASLLSTAGNTPADAKTRFILRVLVSMSRFGPYFGKLTDCILSGFLTKAAGLSHFSAPVSGTPFHSRSGRVDGNHYGRIC